MADGNGRDRAATSAPVSTPITPGTASAADTSTDTIRAWASVERTTAASAMWGSGARSSMNQPSPRRRASSSTRATGRPSHGPARVEVGVVVGVDATNSELSARRRRVEGTNTCVAG